MLNLSKLKVIFSAITIFFLIAVFALDALVRQPFVDEGMAIQAAFHFFKDFQYAFYPDQARNFGAFEPGLSIGIASSWVSGLAWGFGGSVFLVRLAVIFYHFILIFLVADLLAKMRNWNDVSRLVFIAISLFIAIKCVPYTLDSVGHGLGEVSGFLVLLLGFLVGNRSSKGNGYLWGILLLGVCVWHTKFIFFPFAVVGGVWLYARALDRDAKVLWSKEGITELSKCLLVFLLPLLFWLVLIVLRTGFAGLAEWFFRRTNHLYIGNSGLNGPPRVTGLFNRLASPQLEWARSPARLRVEVLVLLFGPIGLLLLDWMKNFRQKSHDWVLRVGLSGFLVFFTLWWFLWHKEMWLRHIQPALLVGFGVLVFYGMKRLERFEDRIKLKLLVVGIGIVFSWLVLRNPFFDLRFLRSGPAPEQFSMLCHSDVFWRKAPMDIPACANGFALPAPNSYP